ncbi:phosphatase PAP2 family protein [Candidatus Marinimicrobia bacterium]|nr:phosphatase PAP2 family protein [Candidatus Neomarinimicrobiota bacterium]
MLDKILEIDKALMVFLNKSISNSFFDIIMPIITSKDFLTVIGVILIIYLGFFCGKRGKITLLVLLFAAGMSDAICAQIIKPWVGRIRPSHEFIDYINLLVKKGGKWSFPSNHAANSFAFATVLSYFYERKKLILFVSASIIAYSRVYVGVHYPLDILFGALTGYVLSWVVLSFWVIIKMRELKKRTNLGVVC